MEMGGVVTHLGANIIKMAHEIITGIGITVATIHYIHNFFGLSFTYFAKIIDKDYKIRYGGSKICYTLHHNLTSIHLFLQV